MKLSQGRLHSDDDIQYYLYFRSAAPKHTKMRSVTGGHPYSSYRMSPCIVIHRMKSYPVAEDMLICMNTEIKMPQKAVQQRRK